MMAVAHMEWPLRPVKSSERTPTPHPMNAIFVATTRPAPAPNSRHHHAAMRLMRPTTSHAAIAMAVGAMAAVSPKLVIFIHGIINWPDLAFAQYLYCMYRYFPYSCPYP